MAQHPKSEFDYTESTVKVSGSAPAPPERAQMEHGEEVYFLARGVITEVSFPEDKKTKAIKRVAVIKLEKGYVVDAEGAETLIAEETERRTGQGNMLAEIKRIEDARPAKFDDADEDDDFDDDEEEEADMTVVSQSDVGEAVEDLLPDDEDDEEDED